MKYPYIVNKNGVWYPAGTEVPEDIPIQNVAEEKNQYTKTEINRMSTAELQALALENGIDGAGEMTGAELKKVLIDKFVL